METYETEDRPNWQNISQVRSGQTVSHKNQETEERMLTKVLIDQGRK